MTKNINFKTELDYQQIDREYQRVFGRNRNAVSPVSKRKLISLYSLIGAVFMAAIVIIVS